MSKSLDHSECRELLRDYRRGRLDAVRADQVSEHLEGCDECRRLHRQLSALGSAESLTEIERTRLRSGVRRRLTQDEHRAWGGGRRLAGALGAAALLAVAAVGAATVFGGGGPLNLGRDDADGGGAQFARPAPEQAEDGAAEEAAPTPEPGSAIPFERYARDLGPRDLDRIGRRVGTRALAKAAAGIEEELDNAQFNSLAPEAVRPQITPCANRVRSATERRVVLARGAVGTVESRSALILAFLLREPGPQRDRYSVWAWPTGSCDQPIARRSGPLPP